MQASEIEAIYEELATFSIELDRDPTARGPGYLQDLISKTRGHLNRVSHFMQKTHREQHHLQSDLSEKEASFQISADALLADDQRVTRLPNINDRQAMINMLLRDDRVKILELRRHILDLGFVDKAIRHRHKELENTMSAIRMQKSLIEAELRTGAYYGDETDTSRRSAWGNRTQNNPGMAIDAIDDEELARLMDEVNTPTPAAPEKLVIGVSTDADQNIPTQAPTGVEAKSDTVALGVEPNMLNDALEIDVINKFLDGDDDFSDVFDNL